MELDHVEDEVVGVVVDEVPFIAGELVADPLSDPHRAAQGDPLGPPDMDPQQRIEADEVVHVHVRHQDMIDAEQVTGRQRGEVAQVEQQCRSLMQLLHEYRGIAEAPVD